MTWVRIDEGFPEHPKVLSAGGDAGWLHVCAISYCNRQLTDGFIPHAVLSRLSDRKRPGMLAAKLVEVGLWETTDGGWTIHDYLLYQPTRSETEATRERTYSVKAEAGRLGGLASGVARRKHTRSRTEANNEAEPKQTESKHEARSVPIRTDLELVRDNSTSVDTPTAGGELIRIDAVADQYARIALQSANGNVNNPSAYLRAAKKTALDHPDLDRYLQRWPDAPANAVAAWLHGDKHSMAYYRDTETP